MTRRIAAVLVVPNGTHRPRPLADAIAALHPDWQVGAVWGGDPQLRPVADGVEWFDDAQLTAEDEVSLVAGERSAGEWRRAIAVVERLLFDGVHQVVVLWVGAVAVISSLDELIEEDGEPLTLVPKALHELPDDVLEPTEADLIASGLYSTAVAVFHAAGVSALRWLAEHLDGCTEVTHLLSRCAQLHSARVCRAESVGVGRWHWDTDAPALLDLDCYDARTPWTLDPQSTRRSRVDVLGDSKRQAVLSVASSQVVGRRTPLYLPGGLKVDSAITRVVAESETRPPAPWSAAAEFRDWLTPPYWRALREGRADLRSAFPDPQHASATAFQQWCKRAFFDDETPLLISPPEPGHGRPVVADPLRQDGLNVVGYFTRQSSLGDVVRRLNEGIRQAGLAHCS